MTKIIITRADALLQTLADHPVAAVLSIEHPEVEQGQRGAAPRIGESGFPHIPQMILSFWDSEQPVSNGPDREQIARGIAFALEHMESGTVIIHCLAGKSRSAAVALGVLAQAYPGKDETELVELLLEIRPVAAPNIIAVEIADDLAGRGGKLTQAVLDHPVISEQRARTEENRQRMLQENPERMRKLFPEKFPKP